MGLTLCEAANGTVILIGLSLTTSLLRQALYLPTPESESVHNPDY